MVAAGLRIEEPEQEADEDGTEEEAAS